MSIRNTFFALALAGAAAASFAQGTPPDARITNHPIAAGQQSSVGTAMGDTGVPVWQRQIVQTAVIVPAPVVVQAPVAPAPVVVVEAPAPVVQTTIMGAPPAEVVRPVRVDRN